MCGPTKTGPPLRRGDGILEIHVSLLALSSVINGSDRVAHSCSAEPTEARTVLTLEHRVDVGGAPDGADPLGFPLDRLRVDGGERDERADREA